jgi:prolyl-tRNA synthetase
MTHEEVVADLVRNEIQSYRQLPALVYQIQTKWRDDPRPRAGLIRVREFTMKDSYSLDRDWQGLEQQYARHYQAYFNIFRRCGLQAVAVKADTGMMGGKVSHEYMYLTPVGEDSLLICDHCGYAANRQVARFKKPEVEAETPRAVEKVATPNCKSIEDLSNFLAIPKAKTAKAVFMIATIQAAQKAEEKFVFAVIRGDMEINETKLAHAVGARELRPATEVEIRAVGAEPGYASPVGLNGVLVVADDLVTVSPNLAAGANEGGYHLLNTNCGRDWQAEIVTDLAAAREGDACIHCHTPLRLVRGVEIGNIFQLGTHFSESLGAVFVDVDGSEKPVVMGSYGIGVGRMLACIAEEHNDQHGLRWPVTVAPYQVHLILIPSKTGGDEIARTAEQVYTQLWQAGIEVLFDDRREESPGVRFNDADLLGLPLRVTVSERALKAGGVEFKRRDSADKTIISLEQLIQHVQAEIKELRAEIERAIKAEDYQAEDLG